LVVGEVVALEAFKFNILERAVDLSNESRCMFGKHLPRPDIAPVQSLFLWIAPVLDVCAF